MFCSSEPAAAGLRPTPHRGVRQASATTRSKTPSRRISPSCRGKPAGPDPAAKGPHASSIPTAPTTPGQSGPGCGMAGGGTWPTSALDAGHAAQCQRPPAGAAVPALAPVSGNPSGPAGAGCHRARVCRLPRACRGGPLRPLRHGGQPGRFGPQRWPGPGRRPVRTRNAGAGAGAARQAAGRSCGGPARPAPGLVQPGLAGGAARPALAARAWLAGGPRLPGGACPQRRQPGALAQRATRRLH